jgi:hypothetical protein
MVKDGLRARRTSLPSVRRMARKCGSFDVPPNSGPPFLVKGIALAFCLINNFCNWGAECFLEGDIICLKYYVNYLFYD